MTCSFWNIYIFYLEYTKSKLWKKLKYSKILWNSAIRQFKKSWTINGYINGNEMKWKQSNHHYDIILPIFNVIELVFAINLFICHHNLPFTTIWYFWPDHLISRSLEFFNPWNSIKHQQIYTNMIFFSIKKNTCKLIQSV